MKNIYKPLARAVAATLVVSGMAYPVLAAADVDTQQEIKALRQQVDILMKKVEELSTRESGAAARQGKIEKQAAAAVAPVPAPVASSSLASSLKNMQFYGNLDISLDDSTKGIAGKLANDGTSTPVGRLGWLPAISTNLSYVGLRGKHDLGDGLAAIFQLETQLDISATAGTSNNNSANDSVVKGALTSRNSFIGLAGQFGAVKIGKTDAPMKISTARMNPFSGTVGDYSAIIGNTGGDNRVEFGTRLDHAIWYESPRMNGFSVSVLWSPGQNRATDNGIQAIGESSCAGGNVPGSGALPYGCNDGSYGTAYGLSGAYEAGGFYAAAAYEMHRAVNRTSDADGTVFTTGGRDYVFDNTVGIGDEYGWRVGAQYKFASRTTLSGVYEDLKRKLPYHYFDERSRKAYWLALSQDLSAHDSMHLGYGHAGKSPGSLGEHNIQTVPNADNASNMYSVMFKHSFDSQTNLYVAYATQVNHTAGHYDLGAGGRANTTDCHDGSQISAVNPADGSFSAGGPFCYVGSRLQAVSVGMSYKF